MLWGSDDGEVMEAVQNWPGYTWLVPVHRGAHV